MLHNDGSDATIVLLVNKKYVAANTEAPAFFSKDFHFDDVLLVELFITLSINIRVKKVNKYLVKKINILTNSLASNH